MRLIIEGWRFLPHSYGVVDQFLCRELRRRGDVELFHRDIPFVDPGVKIDPRVLGDESFVQELCEIPVAGAAQQADATLRLFVPLNLTPAPSGRTLVFGTAEFGIFDENQIGASSLSAVNGQPNIAVLTPSQWSRSGFIRAGADPDKVAILPHGVDPTLFRPADPLQRETLRRERGWSDDFIFLNIGALTANKGVVHLLRAFAALVHDLPKVRLVIKGLDRIYRSASCLDEYLAVLPKQDQDKVKSRLTYIGDTMTYAQTAALYQAADACVSPYHAEGFNLPVLEAAACGLAVICTAGGPTDEFTDPSFALRIDSQLRSANVAGIPGAQELSPDVNLLVAHMRRVYGDREFLNRARTLGPKFVSERFTWKHIADQLLAMFADSNSLLWKARPIPIPSRPHWPLSEQTAELQKKAWNSYKAGNSADVRQACGKWLALEPLNADAIYLLGVLALDARAPQEALLHFHLAASLRPEMPAYHNALGEAYAALGRRSDAIDCFRNALRLNPALVGAHNSLGRTLMDAGDIDAAIASFAAAIAAQPTYERAHLNLGLALHSRGDAAGAKASFLEALRLNSRYAIAHNNLGALLQGQGEWDAAISQFRQAATIDPNYPEAHFNLGSALHSKGDTEGAETALRAAIRLRPPYARAHAMLGLLLQEDGRLQEALSHLDQAVRLRPTSEAHLHRGEVLEDFGRFTEAIESFKSAGGMDVSQVLPFHSLQRMLLQPGRSEEASAIWKSSLLACKDDGAKIRAVLSTPEIFQSAEEMQAQRRRIEEGLTLLEAQNLTIADPLTQVNATNFYSAYHGVDDRAIQVRLANLYLRATPSLAFVAPHCVKGEEHAPGKPLRIGFISSFFHMHTIGEVNLGFIKDLSRETCRVILFPLPGPDDDVSRYIRQSADEVFPLTPSLESARRIIAGQRLDVLFYTDIGMDPFTYFLAFSRLAPVQCVTWGHPDTTGIPTLDYYVSGADLEPPDSDSHYSEKLVKLHGLPTYYHAPSFFPPAKTRAYFGLNEDEHLYLCSQAPFKIHPDYDAMLGEILRADPLGKVLFIRSKNPQWTHQLRRRLRRSLGREFARIEFLPHQGGQDYLHLLNVCDVLLDSTHFGGGNTHLKAFSVGTPVVTLPGAFARSRVATACYRRMGIDECIATDREQYVRIAVQLGTDPDFRNRIHAQILKMRHVLFEDANIVHELEKFFIDAVIW